MNGGTGAAFSTLFVLSGVCTMKWQANVVLILLFIFTTIAGAQSSAENRGLAQETQVRVYWIDPSTGLMWAGKDNGKDVNWKKSIKYCRDLRLAGYSDWRLATIDELQGIYDKNAEAPGLGGKHNDAPFTRHVKGNLFLTGRQWSSSQRRDDRGHPNELVWFLDFSNGYKGSGDGSWSGRFEDYGMRALCVRRSGE
jgi:hypothetical protein